MRAMSLINQKIIPAYMPNEMIEKMEYIFINIYLKVKKIIHHLWK